MFGFAGRNAAAAPARVLAGHIAEGRGGGVLFLDGNIGSRADLLSLTGLFRSAAPDRFLLLAVDQEGGRVQRIGPRQGVDRLPAALRVAGSRSAADAEELYRKAGAELAALGFTLNLAPVVDLHDPHNPVIGRARRAFAADPAEVVSYAAACIAGYGAAGILTAVKHFPGHGRSAADTHEGAADITWSWGLAELRPFARLVAEKLPPMVMVGHLSHAALGNLPASLSPLAIGGVLRRWLGFQGPVISDSLDMEAITDLFTPREAVVRAIAAGVDVVMLANGPGNPDLPAEAVGWIADAVRCGDLPAARIAEAAGRIRGLRRACLLPEV